MRPAPSSHSYQLLSLTYKGASICTFLVCFRICWNMAAYTTYLQRHQGCFLFST